MKCVGMTSAFVCVNDSPTDKFNLESGMRQGDPLSHSFFFFIVPEELNVMLNATKEVSLLSGYKVGKLKEVCIFHSS